MRLFLYAVTFALGFRWARWCDELADAIGDR